MKQALAAWRDSFSNSNNSEIPEDISIMVIEDSDDAFDSLFYLWPSLVMKMMKR